MTIILIILSMLILAFIVGNILGYNDLEKEDIRRDKEIDIENNRKIYLKDRYQK